MDPIKKQPVGAEPKMNNRFVVEFQDEFEIEPYLIQTITRPSLNIDIENIQNHYRYTGKYEWNNIEMTLIDTIGPSTSQGVMNLIIHCKKQNLTFIKDEMEGNVDLTKKILFTFKLKSLDPIGETIETWTIDVKELISVDFGKCDYGNKDMQTIKVVLKPESCTLSLNK